MRAHAQDEPAAPYHRKIENSIPQLGAAVFEQAFGG
jgi:hypothetical protein